MVSIFMYTIYILRLMGNELPAPKTRPGMFISVGPAGYTATAFISLGIQAPSILPPTFLTSSSSPPQLPTGEILRIMGITAGLFIWLLALWFFSVTLWGIVEGFKEMTFTLTWWAFIFPNGGLTLATGKMAQALDSFALEVLTCVMTALLVLVWLVVAGCCVKAVVKKEVLWPGVDDDRDMKAK